MDKGEPRTLHDLSCQFGAKGFTKEMRQIAGGSQSGETLFAYFIHKILLNKPVFLSFHWSVIMFKVHVSSIKLNIHTKQNEKIAVINIILVEKKIPSLNFK